MAHTQKKESSSKGLSSNELSDLSRTGIIPPDLEKPILEALDKGGLTKPAKELERIIKNLSASDEDKKTIFKLLHFFRENKKTFAKGLEGPTKKIRHAGHFVDQKLQYTFPKTSQMNLFEMIESEEVKKSVGKYELELTSPGIRLSPPEDKLVNALQKLLHDKSQNSDIKSEDFYQGNAGAPTVPFGKGIQQKSPIIRIRPAELYKAYLGHGKYSGHDIKFIKDTLLSLADKKYLIVFDRKRQIKKNGKLQNVTDRIEAFQSLINVIKYTEGLNEGEVDKMNKGDDSPHEKKGELLIGLNPILVDQIDTKYVFYPSDINKRMVDVAGGHRHVTEAMTILRDYMLRELSAKRYTVEINEARLPYILKLDNYIKTRKKARIKQRIEDAISAVKNLGIVVSSELVKGKAGQNKYLFKLNKSY